jgi:hypothetical protein
VPAKAGIEVHSWFRIKKPGFGMRRNDGNGSRSPVDKFTSLRLEAGELFTVLAEQMLYPTAPKRFERIERSTAIERLKP